MVKRSSKNPNIPGKATPNDGYKVGPGKPPLHSQYKPGQSGNPGGKKKGLQNVRTVLLEELEMLVAIKGGDPMTRRRALIRSRLVQALKGDPRAIEDVLDRAERHERESPSTEMQADDPGEDAEFLDRAMRRYWRRTPDCGAGQGEGGHIEGDDEPDDD